MKHETLKIVCSYCKKDMGTKPGDGIELPEGVEPVSHSICLECAKEISHA